MKYTIRITTFIKAVMKFAFGLFITFFSVFINLLFSDRGNKQEIHDPLLKNLPQVSWTGIDETSDEGIKVVSKDGFIDY